MPHRPGRTQPESLLRTGWECVSDSGSLLVSPRLGHDARRICKAPRPGLPGKRLRSSVRPRHPRLLIDDAFAAAKRFLERPERAKSPLDIRTNSDNRGRTAHGSENLDDSRPDHVDRKEAFNTGLEHADNDPRGALDERHLPLCPASGPGPEDPRFPPLPFVDPNPDAVIEALPGTGDPKCQPVTGTECLKMRLDATYDATITG